MDLFNTIANATKPQNNKYKTKFYFLRKAVKIIKKSEKNENLHDAVNYVNEIFTIYKDVENYIKMLENLQEWEYLQDDPDFYSLEESIKKAYYVVKDKYHDLHWDQKGFNAY